MSQINVYETSSQKPKHSSLELNGGDQVQLQKSTRSEIKIESINNHATELPNFAMPT